jgi:hypothetical protein
MRATSSSRILLLVVATIVSSGLVYAGDELTPIYAHLPCPPPLDQRRHLQRPPRLSVNCQIADDGDPFSAVPTPSERPASKRLGRVGIYEVDATVGKVRRGNVIAETDTIVKRLLLRLLPQFTE